MSASASSSLAVPVGGSGLPDAALVISDGGASVTDSAGMAGLRPDELEMVPDHAACVLQADAWSQNQVLINIVTGERHNLDGSGWALDADEDGFAVLVSTAGTAEEATVVWPSEVFIEVLHRDHNGAEVVVRRVADGADQVVHLGHERMRREDFVVQWAVGALVAKLSMEAVMASMWGKQSRR